METDTPTESQEAPSDLPELPSATVLGFSNSTGIVAITGYTADQMRSYAAEATNYYRHLLRAANARGDGVEELVNELRLIVEWTREEAVPLRKRELERISALIEKHTPTPGSEAKS